MTIVSRRRDEIHKLLQRSFPMFRTECSDSELDECIIAMFGNTGVQTADCFYKMKGNDKGFSINEQAAFCGV